MFNLHHLNLLPSISRWRHSVIVCSYCRYQKFLLHLDVITTQFLRLNSSKTHEIQGEEEKKTSKHSFNISSQWSDWWKYKYQLLSSKRGGSAVIVKESFRRISQWTVSRKRLLWRTDVATWSNLYSVKMYWSNSKWSYIICWTVIIMEHLNEFIEKFNIQWRYHLVIMPCSHYGYLICRVLKF